MKFGWIKKVTRQISLEIRFVTSKGVDIEMFLLLFSLFIDFGTQVSVFCWYHYRWPSLFILGLGIRSFDYQRTIKQ